MKLSDNNIQNLLNTELSVFKHDFANMVSVINGYIAADDMNGLKKYFSSFQNDYEKLQNLEILNTNIINDAGIYNLISSKYKKATDLNINFQLDIFFDFSKLLIDTYEFSKILGILLDNAIEASKECQTKYMRLSVRESPKYKVQIISIENTFLNNNMDLNKIFNKGISSKQNHFGIGLWEINNILKKYKNANLNTSVDEDIFKQELQIFYK